MLSMLFQDRFVFLEEDHVLFSHKNRALSTWVMLKTAKPGDTKDGFMSRGVWFLSLRKILHELRLRACTTHRR